MVAGHLRIQNGIYQMILSYKDKQNKRKTKSISTHLPVKGNKKKAEAMLAKARKEFIPTLWDKDTDFSTFLSDWIELANFSPDTYADYYMCLNTYIVPYFDTVERSISSITVNDLDTFYKELQKNASIPTSESLKATISLSHTIIKNGLLYAVKAGWIESNPADKLNPSTGEVEILFSDFILDWLEMMKSSVDLNTYAGYLSSAKSSIVPYFNEKGYTLKDLEENPKFIQDYYSYEMNVVGLTSNTVIHRHANIRKCLQYAFQVGLIKSNPADRVERPQKNVFVSEYYDTQELDDLFRAVKGDPIELPVILAAFYGMRRSEIVGLKWNCIDFDKKTISIQHIVTDIYLDGHLVTIEKDKTKTKSSTRTLPLVKPFEDALIALKEQQRQQQKLCGNAYNKDYLEYVLRDKMGNRIKPGYVSQHFRIVLTKNNLKLIRFHDLRHSCASLLYANGVDLKAIQEWLGHSTITTTANTYTHFDFSKKVQSAEAIMGNYPAQIEQKREG